MIKKFLNKIQKEIKNSFSEEGFYINTLPNNNSKHKSDNNIKHESIDNNLNKNTKNKNVNNNDLNNDFNNDFKIDENIVRQISKEKNEPLWMLNKRLEATEVFNSKKMPTWGPDLKNLELAKIKYYLNPQIEEKTSWADIPLDIKKTFDDLGIPQAEHEYLGGVGAQYDSGVVYHKIKDSLARDGVIFENMDTAIHKYEDLVKKYFMNDCVSANEHKFTALHGALWSGGTFIYIPKGVKVKMPLQAYFRMNEPSLGQFEHTLIIAEEDSYVEYIEGCSAPKYNASSLHAGCVEVIVGKNAKVKYISIENWSKNTYNLNTKKAIVCEYGEMNWINGNMGSHKTMLYPTTILIGDNSKNEALGIVFAGENQEQDTGNKVIHIGKNTTSVIKSKSISRNNGISIYRGFVEVGKNAQNTQTSVICDGLILNQDSKSIAIPNNIIKNKDVILSHEARVGKINEDNIFYLKSYGYSEEESIRLIVGGIVGDIIRKLPLEYALEFNRLIDLEMK